MDIAGVAGYMHQKRREQQEAAGYRDQDRRHGNLIVLGQLKPTRREQPLSPEEVGLTVVHELDPEVKASLKRLSESKTNIILAGIGGVALGSLLTYILIKLIQALRDQKVAKIV